MNKQIEEMANAINEMDEPNAHYYGRNLKEHEAFADCFTIAKHLYNAGYRKRSNGEWVQESFKAKNGEILHHTPSCSACGKSNSFKTDFCPNCGAKMKGGE